MTDQRAFTVVREALRRQAAVALIGPRQVGKTTLAHEIGENVEAIGLREMAASLCLDDRA